jgi:hypothetical protein
MKGSSMPKPTLTTPRAAYENGELIDAAYDDLSRRLLPMVAEAFQSARPPATKFPNVDEMLSQTGERIRKGK